MKEYERIIKLAISKGYTQQGDDYLELREKGKPTKMLILWENGMRFCNIELKEIRDMIKEWKIKRIIDEDNNNGIVQSIWSLKNGMLEYSIILSENTYYMNHGTDDKMKAVEGILLDIKKGTETVDYFLNLINK